MSMLDKLMRADAKRMTEKPEKDMEIKRLSKLLGEPFVLHLRSLPTQLLADITEMHTTYTKTGRVKSQDNYHIGIDVIVNGVTDPSFKDKDLLKKFGAATPDDLIEKLFLPGEIGDISNEISSLCGTKKQQSEVDDIVKN